MVNSNSSKKSVKAMMVRHASLRTWAVALGLSHTGLSAILDGSIPLTRELVQKIVGIHGIILRTLGLELKRALGVDKSILKK